MRAPYDTTCDIVDGPGTGSPGAVRHAGVPCRFVDDTRVFQREKWLDLDVAYVTMDESDVHAFFQTTVPPDVETVDAKCDRLAIPSGAAAGYTVLWTERVSNPGHADYYRAHVKVGA